MLQNTLWAAALSHLLRHDETGCPKSARQAADLLDRLSDDPELDRETRTLCARASDRLGDGQHVAVEQHGMWRRSQSAISFHAI